MTMNRAARRRQERADGKRHEKIMRMHKEGASVADLEKAYDGINDKVRGKLEQLARENFKDYSAASLITLMEAGNSRESCIDFVKNTLTQVQNQLTSGEIGETLLRDYGITLDMDDALEPVKLDKNWKDERTVKHEAFWKRENDRPCSTVFVCSECGKKAYDMTGGCSHKQLHNKRKCTLVFCPNCGSRMSGMEEDRNEG